MVDVSAKPETRREAVATGRVRVSSAVVELLRGEGVPKGDALGVARVAGILAAKQTSALIPLCHPLPLSKITVDFEAAENAVTITCAVKTTAVTGVEMEALTGASLAALALYDMIKALDRGAAIREIVLREKSGGRSGVYRRA